MDSDDFAIMGFPMDQRLHRYETRHRPLEYILKRLQQQHLQQQSAAQTSLQTYLVKDFYPKFPEYDPKKEWNMNFLQNLVNCAIYMSNNNIFDHQRVKVLMRLLREREEFRALLNWMLEAQPVAMRALSKLLFRFTLHEKEESTSFNLRTFIPLLDEEVVFDNVLENGRPWCLEYLLTTEADAIQWSSLEEALRKIIVSPRVLTFHAVTKIYQLMERGLDISSLDKYSDTSPEYAGYDFGTKLFLLASVLVKDVSRGGVRKRKPDPTEIGLGEQCTDIDMRPLYGQMTQYLLDHCVADYSKALINAVMPISYLEKQAELPPGGTDSISQSIGGSGKALPKTTKRKTKSKGDRSDLKSYTKGPKLRPFCFDTAMEYILLTGIDINSIWRDGKGKPYHVLTLALRYERSEPVIRYLLDRGADVNVCSGVFFFHKSGERSGGDPATGFGTYSDQMAVPATPLHEAIRAMVLRNIQLILSQRPVIADPGLCLYLACRCRPRQTRNLTAKQRKAAVEVLRMFLQYQNQSFSYETIAKWDTLNAIIAAGRSDIVEEIVAARTEHTIIDIDNIVSAVKAKKPEAFKSLLSTCNPNGDLETRKIILSQVLEKLEQDQKTESLFYTHKSRKHKGMSAHRPLIIYELWKEILGCGLQPSIGLWGKMISPLFWSTIWGIEPEHSKSRDYLQRAVGLIVGRTVGFSEALNEASKHTETQILDALCQPFELQHKACFDRAVKTAIDLRWNIREATKDGLTILHFALANYPKTAQSLVDDNFLDGMPLSRRGKLLILATHYGLKDIVEAAIKGQDDKFVNWSGTLEDFPALNSADIPKLIKGKTTALHIAACHGRRDIVGLLLANGADVNMTMVRRCKERKSKEQKEKELMGKATPNKYTSTALTIAVAKGHSDVVDLLLHHKPEGWRLAEMEASDKGYTEIAGRISRFGLTGSLQDADLASTKILHRHAETSS
ncbi:hypothetical protein TWF696_007283 [Orbilia brochopaga]|uniref:Uncharacterized protein n=1 Tax=Orbilia brochopaga TaxID=3140254 RepID=A0AAV9US78_9PEZI